MNTAHSTPHASSSAAREAGVDDVDGRPGGLQALGGGRHGGGDLRVDGPAAEVDRQRQAQVRRCRRRAAGTGRADRGTDMMSASSGPWVAARNSRASSAQRASGPWWEIESNRPGSTSIGIRPEAGLEPDDAAPRRRDAHRAAHVGALGERRRSPTPRPPPLPPDEPPGVRAEIVGVAGDAPQRAVGLQRVGELRGRGLADDHGAGPAQRRDDGGVAVGHPVLEGVRAERRAVAGDGRRVLDGDRHAVQHAERRRRGRRPARRGRPPASPRRPRSSVKQLSSGWTVDRPIDGGGDHLDRRQLAGRDPRGGLASPSAPTWSTSLDIGPTVQSPRRSGAHSSAGRALPLQGRCRGFESLCAHPERSGRRRRSERISPTLMKRPATVQARLVCVGLTLLPYGVTGHLAVSNLVGTRTYGSDPSRSSEQVIRPTRSVPTERSGDAPQPNNDDEPRSRTSACPVAVCRPAG